MKFGEKRRIAKEQKKEQAKKEQKKGLKILLGIVVACLIVGGIGSLFEGDSESTNPPDSASVTSSANVDGSTPTDDATSTPSTEPEDSTPTAPASSAPESAKPSAPSQPPAQSAVKVVASDIPTYSGSGAYIAVNDNVPYFTDADLTTTAFETYSSLDALGRCGVAYANICTDIMPTEERGSIGQVKPSGWQTVKYDNVDGKYLYNRCHLIGYQLSAENANTQNLITGTRYLNVDGMLPFENMVADYVKETGNHVLYRVTPVFDGDNLVATGVLMEAKSVEDKGEGILFNVFCYNIQPGITIDYATGESSLDGGAATSPTEQTPAAPQAPSTPAPEPAAPSTPAEVTPVGQNYVLNTNTHKFHYPSCGSASRIKDSNRQDYTGTREDLIAQGYSPCGNCDP